MEKSVRSKLSRMNTLEKEVLLAAKSEKVEMTLNTDSAIASGLLIQRLTELYEDPIEASVRETISNALDAVSREHSGKRPEVRVSSPTALNPILVIKDNGIGMTYNDLKEIYSKYGATTKLDDLTQIGAYGLGAKSPLAYGTEFTVTSVRDRQKTTVIVAREELTNYIKIVDSIETDEPSGTTVSIPVSHYDIDKFNNQINKYKATPIDTDVDLYINGKIHDENGFTLINDNVLILDGEEKVYTRVWIHSDSVLKLITDFSKEDIKQSLKFLIGGWAYESPSGRNRGYYRSASNSIIVELKTGIVGFNSSRDAILENDRYTQLENLIIQYVESERFVKDVTVGVNSMEIEDFKDIVAKVVDYQKQWLVIKDGKITVESDRNKRSYVIARNFSLDSFKHNETGFTFNEVIKNIPTVEKPTVAISERKNSYSKVPVNSIMMDDFNRGSSFDTRSVTDINKIVSKIFEGEKNTQSLEQLMISSAIRIFSKDKTIRNDKFLFITDISSEEHLKSLRNGRKTIVSLTNGEEEVVYNTVLCYTQHKKSEVIKMVKCLLNEEVSLQVKDIDTITTEIKEYRAKNRVSPQRRKDKMSTRVVKYYKEDNYTSVVDIEDINTEKNNVIVLTRNNSVDKTRLSMMHNWYCNENKLEKEKVDIYYSAGNHSVVDLTLLQSSDATILRDPSSTEAGLSKFYKENFHDHIVGLNAIRHDEVNTNEKAFVRLIAGIQAYSPSSISKEILGALNNAYQIAEIAEVKLPEMPQKQIDDISKYTASDFGITEDYYSSSWRIEKSALNHLLSIIDEKHHGLLQDMLLLFSNKIIVKNDDGNYEINYNGQTITMDLYSVRKIYQDVTIDSSYTKLVKTQVKAYLDCVTSIVEEMSLMNF